MPQSRKRHVHHEHPKPSAIPAKQRTKGRIIWALLLGVFGLLIGYFASDSSYTGLVIGALLGALLGYYIGMKMEQEAGGR